MANGLQRLSADDKRFCCRLLSFFKINFKNLSGTLSVLFGLDQDLSKQFVNVAWADPEGGQGVRTPSKITKI